MNKIDLHIIHHNESQVLLDVTLASLKDEPVNVHIVTGVDEWPPEQGRLLGYAQGDAPFVSYVDPGDWVEPGSYEKLLAVIKDRDGAFGFEHAHLPTGEVYLVTRPHHGFLLRRGLDIKYETSMRVFNTMAMNKKTRIHDVVYHWVASEKYRPYLSDMKRVR